MRRIAEIGLCLVACVAVGASWATSASATSSTVATWGEGIGPTENSNVPAAVRGLSGVKGISAGGFHALAALSTNIAMAWGENTEGQLGDGTFGRYTERAVPLAVAGLSEVAAVSGGEEHSLALLNNGTVRAWGRNDEGQLGNGVEGTHVRSDVPVVVCARGTTAPCATELSGITAVSGGELHSLALNGNGTADAWGSNSGDGQLGDGRSVNSDVPTLVCAVGTPSEREREAKKEQPGCPAGPYLEGVSAIAAGGDHSLALLSNGTVAAWGFDRYGQLGNGGEGREFDSEAPVIVCAVGAKGPCPNQSEQLKNVTAIAASYEHSVAVLSTGKVVAWGWNRDGELGNGTTTNSDVPVEVSGLSGATAVAAGLEHSVALLSNGTVMAWGGDKLGQLGDGSSAGPEACVWEAKARPCSTRPVQVVALSGVTAISAAQEGSFSLALGALPVLPQRPKPTDEFGLENPAEPNRRVACSGDPVNCATGNLVESQTDLSVSGRGVPLTLTRTYNAQAAVAESSPGPFGYGWSSTLSDHLTIVSGNEQVTVVQANGSTVSFFGPPGAVGELTARSFVHAKLARKSDGTYLYTLPNQQSFHFDANGLLLSEADRNGNTTTLSRNAAGRLEAITDPSGRKLKLTYNAEGLVEKAEDPMGHVVKYAYEARSLKSVTLPGEASPRWQFTYDASHRITTMTDGRGGKTTNEYDTSNRVVWQQDPAGRITTFAYVPFHTKILNKATGSVTDERFAISDEPEQITHGYGTSSAQTETFAYDEAGDLKTVTDGNGHIREYAYDSVGNRITAIDADKHETKWSYNSTHDVISTTSPNGETTTIERDEHGNATSISRPAPGGKTQVTKYKYDAHGDLENVTDSLERTSTYAYDEQGDRVSETDPEGDKRTWAYDEDSRETSTVSPRGNAKGAEASKYTTKIERDAQGRPLTITDPLGHTTKYAYDADGNVESLTDPNGHTTSYAYDADNEPVKVKQPNGTVTETGYDGAGRVTSQTDGNKHTTSYVRNPLGDVSEVIDPLSRKTTKEYDLASNLKSVTDAAKRTTSYTYDPANKLIEVSYSDGKTPTVQYEYDADGNRTKMTDGTGTSSYTYDQLDRLTRSKDGHGDTVGYEYDLANQQTKITYANGKAVSRFFDKAGRLEKVTDWLEHATRFSYDADSDLTSSTFPTETGNVDTYAYDVADHMSEVQMTKAPLTLASIAYTRDNDGQVVNATTKGLPGAEPETAYSYDPNNRLTKGGATTSYEYDAADNPTKIGASSYTYDAASELESGTTTKYSYDQVGERTKLTPTAGSATSYGYDQAGNLTSVTRPEVVKTLEIKDVYGYDGNGLRSSQTIGETTSYLTWDMTDSLPLLLADGQNSYIYGPGGLPSEQINSEGKVLYLHHDQQGSTRLLTGSLGTAEGATTYDAYGKTTASSGTASSALGYDGQYTNADNGLIYLRARSYDPATAQLLSRDPLYLLTGEAYTYGAANPISLDDPGGLIFGIPGTPTWSEVGHGITSAATSVANWTYSHSGEIATVASAASLIPGVDVIAAPIAIGAGAVHGYKNVSEGNYVGAVFDGVGVFGGGLAIEARTESEAWNATARELWTRGYSRPWALDEAGLWAVRYRGLSAAAFGVSLLAEGVSEASAAEVDVCR